jgi:hypothetical protein
MHIVRTAANALNRLFGSMAEQAALTSGVIRRRRKLTPGTLARVFVLGHLRHASANAEQLARAAAQCGVSVTPQAVDQRHTPALANFLEQLFRGAVRAVVGAQHALAPLLERFTAVAVLDSTTITLPDSQRGAFRGCGGSHGGGRAALKLQTELDLRSGGLTHIAVEPGVTADGGSDRQFATPPAGSLRITDLGYFNVAVFAAIVVAGAHFLSRLHFKTAVRLPDDDTPLDLLDWLGRRRGPSVDVAVRVGPERLACRLIAWRLPGDQARRRRRQLRRSRERQGEPAPTVARLAWCDWTILISSVPVGRLTVNEAAVLYRARWQIELLFKRWKSQGRVADLCGSTDVRRMIRLWSRLLAALVQHWLLLTATNNAPRFSLYKAAEAVRDFVAQLLAASAPTAWIVVLETMQRVVAATCRRNPRADHGTFELLIQPGRNNFRLN